MKVRFLSYAILSLTTIFLSSCAQQQAVSYAGLDNNWHITGSGQFSQLPFVSLAIYISANSVFGNGDIEVGCTNNSGAIGGSVSVNGTIAPDGSFTLSNANPVIPGAPFLPDTIQVSIQGVAPTNGAATWAGTYSITNATGQNSCLFNSTNKFVANAYPPLDGTYIGTLYEIGGVAPITVSVPITQGSFTSFSSRSGTLLGEYLALGSTITVSGSPCITSGSSLQNLSSQLAGDFVELQYAMNDGSQLLLSGTLTDQTESKISVDFVSIIGGKCDGTTASGSIMRQ